MPRERGPKHGRMEFLEVVTNPMGLWGEGWAKTWLGNEGPYRFSSREWLDQLCGELTGDEGGWGWSLGLPPPHLFQREFLCTVETTFLLEG